MSGPEREMDSDANQIRDDVFWGMIFLMDTYGWSEEDVQELFLSAVRGVEP